MAENTNEDGIVDFIDFFILQGNWMQSGELAYGDFNEDGFIDEDDFNLLQANWLQTATNPAASSDPIIVWPVLDAGSGLPILSANLSNPANFDDDIDVDGQDVAVWASAYGQDAEGDTDGDGDSDGADFLSWQRNFRPYTLTADFDLDVVADQADLQIWQTTYGINWGGDSNNSGTTDGADFLAWQREFSGDNSAASQSPAEVPEPSAIVLLLSGLALLAASAGPHRS